MSEARSKNTAPGALDLAALRTRLASEDAGSYWRSLEELADSPQFEELVEREFPRFLAACPEGMNRRHFLHLMGASLALAGLTSCTQQPSEKIVPYVQQPEQIIPGQPLRYASSFSLDGFAEGILVESHMGRPTKVEGNPQHPASLGATNLFAQASILGLYDPDRSQVVRQLGRIRSWEAFVRETQQALQALNALGGARLRVLTGTVTSPTIAGLIRQVLETYPRARWHQYSPVVRDAPRQGARRAFGEDVATRYDLSKADVIVALDSDFLTAGPGAVRYARDFAAGRRARATTKKMNRLYSVEATATATGATADHRLALSPGECEHFVVELARALGLSASDTGAAEHTTRWAAIIAADLRANFGRAVVVPGDSCSPAVHVLVHAINARLGAPGRTLLYSDAVEAEPIQQTASLTELVTDMNAGEVDVLLVLGVNPVYETPGDLDFAQAMLKVSRKIHLGLYIDETAEYCDWHVPQAHSLESWSDDRAFDGTVTLGQPLIDPLYGGKTTHEVLAVMAPGDERTAGDIVKEHWLAELGGADADWRRALHDGFVPGTELPHAARGVRPPAEREAIEELITDGGNDGTALVLRADPTIYDGRFSNNGWLQECPKPLSKLTWDNALLVAPALAERLNLANEQVATVSIGERSLEAPVWIQPGLPADTATLHLGYGRKAAGRVGSRIGTRAYALRGADAVWTAAVEIRGTAGSYPLASTQLHHNIRSLETTALESREAERRELIHTTTLAGLATADHGDEEHGESDHPSLFPPHEYDGHAWGLAVDLTACTGCNACVMACQSENNIPIVGKEQVQHGREMHWLRIDRYYAGDLDNPSVHHQPVMCMHCEQAPCEVVCPVAATVHSDEGLNDMVYNRCVGTRYCSNNCPYKVRRFNFLKYNDTETPVLQMMRNPDVTVRFRGVMEKCSYCVQRISQARIEASKEQRSVRDGDIVTACQQACPSEAIVFGDINDETARVTQWKHEPHNYTLLDELDTRPRTSYLARVRNPNPELSEV